MKIIYLILSVLFLGVLVCQGYYLTQSSILASESVKAEDLKSAISKLDEQNKILKSEILSQSSLLIVASRASEIGFEKPKEYITLKDTNSIALSRE